MVRTGTEVQQWNREMARGKTRLLPMKKRQPRGPTAQRNITLPLHVWSLLEEACRLQSESYTAMGGSTKFAVSDLLESGARMYLRTLYEDLGPFPEDATTRKSYVKRLAELNQKELVDDVLGIAKPKSH